MKQDKQKTYTNGAIALFDSQIKSLENGKVTINVIRTFSKKGNIAEKLETGFAKGFFASVCLGINKMNGHSARSPLTEDKYMSHKRLIEAVENGTSLEKIIGILDGDARQKKLATLNKNIKAALLIEDNDFSFSNANLTLILKAAAKCYRMTTKERPVIVKKAKKASTKATQSKKPSKAVQSAGNSQLTWFAHLKNNGRKPNEVQKGTAIYNKLKTSFVAARNA